MGSHHPHLVFHRQIAVGGTRTKPGILFQIIQNQILDLIRETTPRTKFRERHPMLVRERHFPLQPLNNQLPIDLIT